MRPEKGCEAKKEATKKKKATSLGKKAFILLEPWKKLFFTLSSLDILLCER